MPLQTIKNEDLKKYFVKPINAFLSKKIILKILYCFLRINPVIFQIKQQLK